MRSPRRPKHGRAHGLWGLEDGAAVQAARSLENANHWINEAFEEAFHDIRQRVEART